MQTLQNSSTSSAPLSPFQPLMTVAVPMPLAQVAQGQTHLPSSWQSQPCAAKIMLAPHVALTWGAFFLDGMLEAVDHPNSRRLQVLAAWPNGFDQLIKHNTAVLMALAEQMQPFWSHQLMQLQRPAVFEYLVVSALGDFVGRYLIEHHGQYPEPDAYGAQITMYLKLFFAC
jgi:hypothetical protein